MSQHIAKHPSKPSLSLTYGYDRPLRFYFYTVRKGDKVVDCDNFSGCSAGTLLQKAEDHGFVLPDAHREALALDLPF